MQTVNTITRFESFLEGLVERSFARLFRTRLQPIEVAKRLAREMEAGRVVGVSSVLAPNQYTVALSADDFATFAPIRASLEQEMAQYLQKYAREHGYSTTAPPEVCLSADATLRRGHMVVTRQLTEPPPGAELPTEKLERTQVMPQASDPVAAPSMAQPGEAYLTLGATTYPLRGADVSLGRGLENAIVLEDRRISRSHARLTANKGHWTIHDEGSTNGTFVNGRMVTQHALTAGDRVSLGGLEMVFHQQWDET